jgi:hypothetical protein
MPIIKLRLSKNKLVGLGFGVALALQAFAPFLTPSASAGTLTNTLVRFDRLSQAVATTGTVCAKPATVGAESTVAVTFPTGFTVSTTAANWTTNTTSAGYGWPTGAVAWLSPGTSGNVNSAAATSAVGQVVTWGSSDLTVGTLYCFNWTTTTGLTSVGTAGNYTGTVATNLDTGNYAVTTVGAGADQVTVTATVNPAFSMSLSTTNDPLGTITTAAVKTSASAIQATVSTNAANGWYLWGKDSQAGLNSSTASYTIPSNCSAGVGTNTTLSAGTEGYNLGARVNAQGSGSGGTTSIAAVFDDTSTAGKGGGLCSTAGYQTIASSTGTANAAKVDMRNNAAISGVTKAATDYTDLETFVGAGLF